MLRGSCPNLLSHGFIVLYFLRGPSVILSTALPGVQKQTITSIAKNNGLRELHLIGFDKYPDSLFASLLSSLPQLRILVLRGCAQVSAKTAEAAASCIFLTKVNLNYTGVAAASVAGILASCSSLETLKVAGISSWTDATFAKLLDRLAGSPDIVFRNLHNLKFRQLALSDASVQSFLMRCPNLKRLDLSFTNVRRPPPTMNAAPPLEKLSLTSTNIQIPDVVALITALPGLRILSLGAIGGGQGSSVSMGNSSALNMTDEALVHLTDALQGLGNLEKVSLVGNSKLGLTSRGDGALADFLRKVGRKCKSLNLSGLQHLRSRDLFGFLAEAGDDGSPQLEEIALNHTGIDDEAAPYLSCCSSLVSLQLAGTKMTSWYLFLGCMFYANRNGPMTGAGLFPIIDACPKLEQLDLTSCRGIRIADRRRFFE
ncbi:hypothetical protein ID866_5478, partial [Astraeus odoratus]